MRHEIMEYAVDNQDSGPYGITVGRDCAIWFTQQKGNQIGRIDAGGTTVNLQNMNCRLRALRPSV